MKFLKVNSLSFLTLSLITMLGLIELRAAEEDLIYREIATLKYDVKIQLLWEQHPSWTQDFRNTMQSDLKNRIQRSVRDSWTLSIADSTLNGQKIEPHTDHSAISLQHKLAAKTFVVTITHQAGQIQIAIREGDRTTQQWGLIRRQQIDDDRFLAASLHRLIGESFRPVYQISQIQRDQIDMIAIAGEWTLDDTLFSCFQVQGLARPVILYRDRDQQLQQIQTLPLTYLSMDSRLRARITARLLSAFPAPLGRGRSNRVSIWALGERPLSQPTTVKLVMQGAPDHVLMGHRVVIQPKRSLKDEPTGEPKELLSDRQGQLSVSALNSEELVWLYVWSGEALLARVPFIPGWADQEILTLPDDSDRLKVEGELERLRADLVADVSRRAISRIRILQEAKRGDADLTSRLRVRHDALPNRQSYQSRLEIIQEEGVRASLKSGNRIAASRIEKACEQMESVINRFLNPDRDVELKEEADALLKSL